MKLQIKTYATLLSLLTLLAGLNGCTTLTKPVESIPPVTIPAMTPPTPTAITPPALQISDWNALAGWPDDDLTPAWEAFLQGCNGLKNQTQWQLVCKKGQSLPQTDTAALRTFFEQYFLPYQLSNPDGTTSGLITGYYEPLLKGALTRSAKYRYPLYATPEDMLTVDLSSVYPELKGMRLRGRLQGNKVIPYFNRADIENGLAPLKGKEIVWVDNAIDLFFLQIQGSGRVKLENGDTVRVGYHDQNGYPYKSIGKVLVERGELPLEKASLQGIKDWARKHPEKVTELLNNNASYVFFREMPNNQNGPLGSLGIPLTAGRSIAVDPRTIPLGAPVFLATTWPNSDKPLNRLMLAQDTGGAIKGSVRADFYWGFGNDAGALAGGMRQKGNIWVLLPKDYPIP